MTVQGSFQADASAGGEAHARLAEENALLRASLAELRARLDEMEQASERDPLTGLPNRPSFLRALERTVSNANRHGTPAALLYIDVDGLDAINSGHGQIAGDAALIHLGKLLSGLIRGTDFAARVGGDEFAVILDHLDTDSAIETAERIGRFIAAHPLDLGAGVLPVPVSIGLATIMRGDTSTDVLHRGEVTMHKAKVRYPPVSPGRRNVRVLYAVQTGVAPPSFVLFTNVATTLHFSYERFLENQLRDHYGFVGTPLRITVRRRSRGAGTRES